MCIDEMKYYCWEINQTVFSSISHSIHTKRYKKILFFFSVLFINCILFVFIHLRCILCATAAMMNNLRTIKLQYRSISITIMYISKSIRNLRSDRFILWFNVLSMKDKIRTLIISYSLCIKTRQSNF